MFDTAPDTVSLQQNIPEHNLINGTQVQIKLIASGITSGSISGYFYNENGKIVTKVVSKFEYYVFKYFKTKYKKRKFYCKECQNIFEGFVKNSRQQIECPFC